MNAFAADHLDEVVYLGAQRPVALARPKDAEVAAWVGLAEAHLEDALARLDQAVLLGEPRERAAEQLVREFMAFTRQKLRRFVAREDRLALAVRQQEAQLWDRMAEGAVAELQRDEQAVERFLRVWLGVALEAARTGHAELYASGA